MKRFVIIFIISALLFSCGGLLDQPPGSIIRISDVSAITAYDSATIIWTTDIPTINQVRYGTTSGSYTQSTPVTTSPSVLHSVSIASLANNTTYYFIVENSAYGATLSTSGESSFTTVSLITVSNLRAENMTLVSADILWNTDVATTHLVEYGTVSGSYAYSTIETTSAVTLHTISLSGLTSGTTYYYRVKNFHATVPDAVSPEQFFATATETPPTAAQKARGIWIVGGLSTSAVTSPIAPVDLYDPVTNTWFAAVTNLPTPVSFAAVASWGGKIYVMGGFDNNGNVLSLNQEYTITSNSWINKSPISGGSPRANIFAVMTNNRIYVLGGTTGNATALYAGATTSYEYNPATDMWATKTPIVVTARSEILEFAFNDVVFHLGGRSAGPTVQGTHDGLAVSSSPPLGVLTTAAETLIAPARTGHSGTIYAPSGYPAMMVVVGGYSLLTGSTGNYVFYATSASTPLNNFQFLYFPFSAPLTWQNAASAYLFPCGFSATALSGSTLYVFGGVTSHNVAPLNNVNSFNLDNLYIGAGTWTGRAPMPNGRFGHGAVTINP